jgi:hypothetical protein
MKKQKKAQNLLKLIILCTGITFILAGFFSAKFLNLLHSHNILLNIQNNDLAIIKYAFYGMGIMDIIGAFLFPKFIGEDKTQ